VMFQRANDPLRELFGFGGRRQDLDPRRQHLFPADTDLPGPRLVCEKDDAFPALVDAIQEAEDDVECLRSRYFLTILCSLAGGSRSMASPSM
jgi:hypothetical protein